VRSGANGCHCPVDDDFKKCYATSCEQACTTSDSVKLEWSKVPLWEEMVGLMDENRLTGLFLTLTLTLTLIGWTRLDLQVAF